MEPVDGTPTALAGLLTGAPPVRRPRRLWWRVLVGLVVSALVLVAAVLAGGRYLQHRLSEQIVRIPDPFHGLKDRPVKPDVGTARTATNILLLGTDRRSDEPTTGTTARAPAWVPGLQRSDTMMLVHVAGDRQSVSVVSIPRDAWVSVPGHGHAKVNAAFSWGGPSLTVQTVERLTGVRIDHLAVVDWDGFRRITDLLGGVTVEVPRTVYDSARGRTWTAGAHHLDGDAALLYVRQRHGLPRGDFDRVERQQYLVRQLLDKVAGQGLWSNPVRRYRMLDAVTANLSVDAGWSFARMRHLAAQLAHVPVDAFHFTTMPVAGTGTIDGQSVVFVDPVSDHDLFAAINEDRAPAWFASHPARRLPARVG
jgi:LCP family protein required for cell wall assembly